MSYSYEQYQYLYPPRPETASPVSSLDGFKRAHLIGEPKLNGDCALIFTNGIELHMMNRHKEPLRHFKMDTKEILHLHDKQSGWLVLVGEHMNTSKKDENGKIFNNKLCLFDILVYESNYLIGVSYQQRLDLMSNLYGKNKETKPFLSNVTENIYKIIEIEKDFKKAYDRITPIDMYEGLVMKDRNAKLEPGFTQKNNVRSQFKVRKETLNYKY